MTVALPNYTTIAVEMTLGSSSSSSLKPRVRKSRQPRPIPNSYWATPSLVACEYPWEPCTLKPKLDALLSCGVRTFIDLTEAGELSPYTAQLATRAALLEIDVSTIEYHRFPIRDRSLPESVDQVHRVLSVLKDNEQRGRISAVHCRGGIGRTGLVVGCWLVESGFATDGDDALDTIADEWKTVEKCVRYPQSPETGPQFEFVRNFKRSTCMLLKSKSWARPGMKEMVCNVVFALLVVVLRHVWGDWFGARKREMVASSQPGGY